MRLGSIVRYRDRDWVVAPADERDLVFLKPLGGSLEEGCFVYLPLIEEIGKELDYERIEQSQFPFPEASSILDHGAVKLFTESVRLLLRDGTAPFRSFGRISVRPRPYQLVPLIMALRMNPVRLLIADDVGIGKTIEALLIAKELLERGEIRRVAVLCPPYLCEQWQKELSEKFNIDAVVVRNGTIPRLERQLPPDKSIFDYYQHFVASIDLLKSDKYRTSFLQYCPEFVIVDEAHIASRPPNPKLAKQHQRYRLLKEIVKDQQKHLVLLTATPHSGIEDAFKSLLGLLKPAFEELNLDSMSEEERKDLAKHFVQRRRADVRNWLGEETPFPQRESYEVHYTFSPEYKRFYDKVYRYAQEMVESAESLTGFRKRKRFWSALALLRCVTSSPAAAEATLRSREARIAPKTEDEEEVVIESILDPSEAENLEDTPPSEVIESEELRRLSTLASQAKKLRGSADTKLEKLKEIIAQLLKEGYSPIVWCRYINTSNYVAESLVSFLKETFGEEVGVVSVTGELSEEERKLKVEDLSRYKRRVLVATDCLSEGINLQEHFNAVVHYDLPWNPNRLEQREGRVDRFGQPSPMVKTILLYGRDNPVDGAVLDVLLRKAKEIYRSLGIYVPVPFDDEGIMEAILQSLFERSRKKITQSSLFGEHQTERDFHRVWDEEVRREKVSRTRFAQHSIKPEEVEKELRETDKVLGSPEDVRMFLLEASQRLNFTMRKIRDDIYELNLRDLPQPVKQRLETRSETRRVTFSSPTPEDVVFVGRNHPLVESLAEYIFNAGISGEPNALISRIGVIKSRDVDLRTTLIFSRPRYILREGDRDLLLEEVLIQGFRGMPPDVELLTTREASRLYQGVRAHINVSAEEKREVAQETLGWEGLIRELVKETANRRRTEVLESHRSIRRLLRAGRTNIEVLEPDVLSLLVILPVPVGIKI